MHVVNLDVKLEPLGRKQKAVRVSKHKAFFSKPVANSPPLKSPNSSLVFLEDMKN